MDKINEIWPAWHEVELIGHGAFGQVYKARREELGEVFYSAVKVIEIPSDEREVQEMLEEGHTSQSVRYYFESIVKDLMNEIKVLEILKSAANIVNIEDFSVKEKQDGIGWEAYIRMELLENLDTYRRNHTMSQNDVVKLGIDLCRALEYCQQSKIVHRDIKPKNIFVDAYGNYKLGDFGIARQMEKTQSTMSRKGTDAYMAPEVRFGDSNSSYNVDIYSLGVVMYRLLNRNHLPFEPVEKELISYQEKENALAKRLKGEPLPLPVDADTTLGRMIVKACEFSREKRYQSASEMKRDLIQWQRSGTAEQERMLQKEEEVHTSPLESSQEEMERTRAAFEETRKEEKREEPWEKKAAKREQEMPQPEDGRDIRTTVFLSREKAVAGTKAEIFVPELRRMVSVRFPDSVKEEYQLMLPGEGEPGRNGGRNGSLYLTIHINEQKSTRKSHAKKKSRQNREASAETMRVKRVRKLFVLLSVSAVLSCLVLAFGLGGAGFFLSTLPLGLGIALGWKHYRRMGIFFVAVGSFWCCVLILAIGMALIPAFTNVLIPVCSIGSFVTVFWAGKQASVIAKERDS